MKKIFLIIIIYCIFAPVSNVIYATEQTTQEELIQSQIQDMNINSIIDKAEKDTKNNIDFNTIFEESLQGNLSQNIIINTVGKILGTELKESLKMLVSILLISTFTNKKNPAIHPALMVEEMTDFSSLMPFARAFIEIIAPKFNAAIVSIVL